MNPTLLIGSDTITLTGDGAQTLVQGASVKQVHAWLGARGMEYADRPVIEHAGDHSCTVDAPVGLVYEWLVPLVAPPAHEPEPLPLPPLPAAGEPLPAAGEPGTGPWS